MTRAAATVTRVQTGVRVEARLLNVLKALAALKSMSLGDLLEGIVLHAFAGQCAFGEPTLQQIAQLKQVYGLTLEASDSHALVEQAPARRSAARPARTTAARQRRRP